MIVLCKMDLCVVPIFDTILTKGGTTIGQGWKIKTENKLTYQFEKPGKPLPHSTGTGTETKSKRVIIPNHSSYKRPLITADTTAYHTCLSTYCHFMPFICNFKIQNVWGENSCIKVQMCKLSTTVNKESFLGTNKSTNRLKYMPSLFFFPLSSFSCCILWILPSQSVLTSRYTHPLPPLWWNTQIWHGRATQSHFSKEHTHTNMPPSTRAGKPARTSILN